MTIVDISNHLGFGAISSLWSSGRIHLDELLQRSPDFVVGACPLFAQEIIVLNGLHKGLDHFVLRRFG
jgi:hypothetical protein